MAAGRQDTSQDLFQSLLEGVLVPPAKLGACRPVSQWKAWGHVQPLALRTGRRSARSRRISGHRWSAGSTRRTRFISCPAAFLAPYPRGRTGMLWRSQGLPRPRPDRPNSLARMSTGVFQTKS